MDTVFLFLVRMLILQCFLHWCSPDENTYTLESFKRWNKTKRFLKAECDKGEKAFELSFTGLREEDNTTFTFKHVNNRASNPFTIHLANDTKYFLAVDDDKSGLVVKKQSDTNGDPTRKANDKFKLKRVSVPLTNGDDSCYLHVIESVGTRKVIKSDKSGLVSLGKEDKFGACWIRIKPRALVNNFPKVITNSCILH